MLARLQRRLVLGAVMLGLAWFVYFWRAGPVVWAWAGVCAMLVWHMVVLAIEFALMMHVNRGDPGPRPRLRSVLAAWWGESRAAPRVFCWQQPFRSRRWPDHLPTGTAGRRGVVLVHGFVCNRGLWNRWMARLVDAGVPFVAVDLEPVFGSIDDYSGIIDGAVRRIAELTGVPPVIVAHSMGGLAARAWLAGLGWGAAACVHHVITIGTPHSGTWLARWAVSRNARQMRRSSEWLRQLAARDGASRAVPFTCYYGNCDNIVFPASTAALSGADNRHLSGVAHLQMVDHREPFDELMRQLALR